MLVILDNGGVFEEVVTRNNNQIKLADAITYDDAGNIIPLSQRANFEVNDMRYALLPFGIGAGLLSTDYLDGQKKKIKASEL